MKKKANMTVSEKAVLKGWRCPTTKLWRIPLQDSVSNANTDTLLLNGPTGNEPLNALYSVLVTCCVPCSGGNGPIEESLFDPMLVQLQVEEREWRCTCGPLGLCKCAGVFICMGRREVKGHFF